MTTKADEIKRDIEEFNKFLQQANRQRSKDVLSLEVRRLQTELSKLTDESKTNSVKPANAVPKKCYEVKLHNYGWDQTPSTVKLYIPLKDVQQLSKEAVTCNFGEKSLDLQVLGLENKNYSLNINNLCEKIDVDKSSVKVKTDTVLVSLVKKEAREWSHVTGVEKRIKEAKSSAIPDMSDDSDPNASLMNLMKKMYQEGDDEMKKTIAKAFTERQEKNTAGMPDLP